MKADGNKLERIYRRTDGQCHICGSDCVSVIMGPSENVARGKSSIPVRVLKAGQTTLITCMRPL